MKDNKVDKSIIVRLLLKVNRNSPFAYWYFLEILSFFRYNKEFKAKSVESIKIKRHIHSENKSNG